MTDRRRRDGEEALSPLPDRPAGPGRASAAVRRRGPAFPILMYHHVRDLPPEATSSRYMFVDPARFRAQMTALKRLGFIGCSLAELEHYLSGRKRGRAVGITFDDGYRNVVRNALPVLAELGFTSTTYFVSGQIDGSNVWDAGRLPYEPCMSRAELREWADHGQEVGAHTVTHARLGTLSDAEARQEITGCKSRLEDLTGRPVKAFSYPFGSHTDRVVEITRDSGFSTATTTIGGKAHAGDDRLRLPRVTVRRSDRPLRFLWRRVIKVPQP